MTQDAPCAPMCAPNSYHREPNGGRRMMFAVMSTIISAFVIGTFAWAWSLNVKVAELQSQVSATRVELNAELRSQRLEWGLLVKALDKRMVQVEKDHSNSLGRPHGPPN